MDDQKPKKKKLSAVIVCYTDELSVPIMHQRLTAVFQKLEVDYEIIFVNNGSVDNGGAVMAEIASRDSHVTVINLARNFHSQSAFTSGMQVATGDAVILLDGDLQDPPEMIEEFYNKWQEGYEVVYGVRVKREAPRFMQVAYKAFYRVFRASSYVKMPVDAGDFSLLDRRAVDAMNSLPENNRFIRGLRAWVGFRQTGIPYVRPERMFGKSSANLISNLAWARKLIFSFSYKPLEFITILAFVTVLAAFIGIIYQLIIRLFFPDLVPNGLTPIIILILFMGGIQLLCLSIIGSYLAHIYDEVKRRPPYIVDSIINPPGPLRRDITPPPYKTIYNSHPATNGHTLVVPSEELLEN
jgi:dolichol-phosphate mannosyltransferase